MMNPTAWRMWFLFSLVLTSVTGMIMVAGSSVGKPNTDYLLLFIFAQASLVTSLVVAAFFPPWRPKS